MTTMTMPVVVPEAYRQLVRASSPRPRTFADVVGNARAKDVIREACDAARVQNRAVAHLLLYGPPGMGKTTLARLVAQEQAGGFVETTASTLHDFSDVIRILAQLNDEYERTGRPSTLFLDEVHRLGDARGRQSIDQEAIYSLLEDGQLHHNLLGKVVTGHAGGQYRLLTSTFLTWPFTCVAATTEPGQLSSPLLRRFLLHVELAQYTLEEIAEIIGGSAARLTWPIDADATAELAAYSRLNPGRANQLLVSAHNRALATGRARVTLEVAREVIERLRLHPLGLAESDVKCLRLLAERAPRGVGAAEIARVLGISLSNFTGLIEPFLSRLAFIQTLSRRCISPEGARYLAALDRSALGDSEHEDRKLGTEGRVA